MIKLCSEYVYVLLVFIHTIYIYIFVFIPVYFYLHTVNVSLYIYIYIFIYIYTVSGTTFGNWLIYFGFVGCHNCNCISPARMFPRNPTFWNLHDFLASRFLHVLQRCNQLIALVTGLDLPGFSKTKNGIWRRPCWVGLERELVGTNKPPGRRDLDLWWNWIRLALDFNKSFCHEAIPGWWFQIFFIFTPIWGEDSQFDSYFSNGLKPPTRYVWWAPTSFVHGVMGRWHYKWGNWGCNPTYRGYNSIYSWLEPTFSDQYVVHLPKFTNKHQQHVGKCTIPIDPMAMGMDFV